MSCVINSNSKKERLFRGLALYDRKAGGRICGPPSCNTPFFSIGKTLPWPMLLSDLAPCPPSILLFYRRISAVQERSANDAIPRKTQRKLLPCHFFPGILPNALFPILSSSSSPAQRRHPLHKPSHSPWKHEPNQTWITPQISSLSF